MPLRLRIATPHLAVVDSHAERRAVKRSGCPLESAAADTASSPCPADDGTHPPPLRHARRLPAPA